METRIKHNFGMAKPEGYRKVQRLIKLAEKFKLPLSYCGEDAGRPIEALVLCSLGFKTLSMQPNCIAPVKSLLRNIKLSEIKQIVEFALEANYETVRNQVVEYLEEIKYIQTV